MRLGTIGIDGISRRVRIGRVVVMVRDGREGRRRIQFDRANRYDNRRLSRPRQGDRQVFSRNTTPRVDDRLPNAVYVLVTSSRTHTLFSRQVMSQNRFSYRYDWFGFPDGNTPDRKTSSQHVVRSYFSYPVHYVVTPRRFVSRRTFSVKRLL